MNLGELQTERRHDDGKREVYVRQPDGSLRRVMLRSDDVHPRTGEGIVILDLEIISETDTL